MVDIPVGFVAWYVVAIDQWLHSKWHEWGWIKVNHFFGLLSSVIGVGRGFVFLVHGCRHNLFTAGQWALLSKNITKQQRLDASVFATLSTYLCNCRHGLEEFKKCAQAQFSKKKKGAILKF